MVNEELTEYLKTVRNSVIVKGNTSLSPIDQFIDSLGKYPLKVKSIEDASLLIGFNRETKKIIKKFFIQEDIKKNPSKVSGTLRYYDFEEVSTQPSFREEVNEPLVSSTQPQPHQTSLEFGESISFVALQHHKNGSTCVHKTSKQTGTSGNGKSGRAYIPKTFSGCYAILIALFQLNATSVESGKKKAEIIPIASEYSTTSFYPEKFNTGCGKYSECLTLSSFKSIYFTAWSGMRVLLNKRLVVATAKSKPLYYLSIEGRTLAEQLHRENEIRKQTEPEFMPHATSKPANKCNGKTNRSFSSAYFSDSDV